MFYAYACGHRRDVDASACDAPISENEALPAAKAFRPDYPSHVETVDLSPKATSRDPSRTFNESIPPTQHIPGLASQTQSHVDTTSLCALALGTFPTTLLLFIVLRGIPPRGRDNRTLHAKPDIPNTVVIYTDFLERRQASLSPQFTDGEYTPSVISDSAPATPLQHDGPTAPPTPDAMEAHAPDGRNLREAFLREWELEFVSSLCFHLAEATH